MVRKPMLSHLAPQAATRFDADIKYCPLFFTFFSVTDSIAHLNDIFHPLTVVLYNFPLCVFGNSVIRTGDIPQFFCHWFEPLDFFVDGGIIKGQEVFAHSADSFHLFSILGAPGGYAGVPGTYFDGKHGVDSIFQPGGEEGIYQAVTVYADDADMMRV